MTRQNATHWLVNQQNFEVLNLKIDKIWKVLSSTFIESWFMKQNLQVIINKLFWLKPENLTVIKISNIFICMLNCQRFVSK